MQEKVAEEMIKMAQSMKQTSLIARDIIKADNAVRITSKDDVIDHPKDTNIDLGQLNPFVTSLVDLHFYSDHFAIPLKKI